MNGLCSVLMNWKCNNYYLKNKKTWAFSCDVSHLIEDYRRAYLVIVVSECPAQFVIVHIGLVLAGSPQPGHLLSLQQFELPFVIGPADELLIVGIQQKLKQELPQGDGVVHVSHWKKNKAGTKK